MGWEGTEREQPRQGRAGEKEGCKKLHLHPGGRGPEGLILFFKECERPPLESLLPPESRDGKGNQLNPQQLGVRLESGNLRVRYGVGSREKSEVPWRSPWMPDHLGAGVGSFWPSSGDKVGLSSRGVPDSRHSPGLLVGAQDTCWGYSLPGVIWGTWVFQRP